MSDAPSIVNFPRKGDLPECPISVERASVFCQHPKIRLVEQDRNLVCAECGATLDPFDYLRDGAYAVRRAWDSHRAVAAKVEELRSRIEHLEKERRRLTSSVRRLRDKAAADVVDVRKPL